MKGDFSRVSFDPLRRFTGVLQQQGRTQLDADFNEQGAIVLHHLRALAADMIGPHGGPGRSFAIAPVADDAGRLIDLEIAPGHYYVDGILCETAAPVRYAEQPDYVPAPAARRVPDPPFLVYLDVWERYVSAVEDPSIRDPALGGADTAGRARVVWQVKILPGCSSCRGITALQERRRGSLRCSTPDDSGYRGLENQLYRVEIHGGGAAGTAGFKWSRDNGSTAFGVSRVDGERVALSSYDGDLEPGELVELQYEALVLGEAPDPPPLLEVVEVNRDEGVVTLSAAPKGTATLLRRWDGVGTVREGDGLGLEHGIEVRFEDEGASYRSGDYWVIPARASAGDVIWPAEPDGRPAARPPAGVDHHLAPLAVLRQEGDRLVTEDCRHEI